MFNSKLVAILVSIVGAYLFQYTSNMYIPEGFEKPIWYKAKSTMMCALGTTARLASKLNLGSEPKIWKNLLSKSGIFLKILSPHQSDVNIVHSIIASVPVRIYTPRETNERLPLMIYYHGGAYVFGDLDAFEGFMIELCKQARIKIISVDYRLAPEHPMPTPIDDCFSVTEYVMENAQEFNINSERVVLAGDSAGGNAVAVITQRFVKTNAKQRPKLQILIYPWTQMYNTLMPSANFYANKGFLSHSGFSFAKYRWWISGVHNVSEEMMDAVMNNEHQLLIDDENLRIKYETYLDIDLIPEKYKLGRSYYENYKSQSVRNKIYPQKLPVNSFFARNKQLGELFFKQITPEISPGLADDHILAQVPQAYVIVLEWDSLKDEGLIYSERLRRNGVKVDVAFYEKVFHGMIPFVSHGLSGYLYK